MKSRAIVVLVASLSAATAVGLALMTPYHIENYALGLILLGALAAVGGAGPVRIPTLKTSISTSDAFVLTAVAFLGPMPAVVVAAAGVVGSIFGHQTSRKPIQFAFNTANMMFSTVVASAVFLLVGPGPGAPLQTLVLPLFLATNIYLLVNTFFVALAVSLDTSRPILPTWIESARWAAVSAWLGMTLAVVLLWAIEWVGLTGLALGVPPGWMLASFYRTHKERQEDSQRRIDQVEELNEELEVKVAARTTELRKALADVEKANRSLLSANEELKETDRAKSEFLANVSHELRTPLNAIIGFSDLLQDPKTGALGAQQSEFVRDIHESGEHLLGLINGILDLTKIEAGRMQACPERVHVPRVLNETVAMVRPQASEKKLELVVVCADDLLVAELDRGMLRQALLNLLANAVKFTPDGGKISLEARRKGDDLEIAVSDTGIGLSPDDVDRVFKAFYQVDGSYARQYEGTGLGLTLVRRLVELQDGHVRVESELDVGSCFTLTFRGRVLDNVRADDLAQLPAAGQSRLAGGADSGSTFVSAPANGMKPRSAARRATDTVKDEPVTPVGEAGAIKRPPGRTVLLVEDNPVNAKLARNILRSNGYRVLEADTGEKALGLLAESAVDLVLMDIHLPGIDGIETTRRIKASRLTADVIVVAVTAHGNDLDDARLREAGFVGVIQKPIRLAQFPIRVAEYMNTDTSRACVSA